jgi:hypothetical protein
VAFGRSSFKLEEESVALALEAVIGGFCGSLNVSRVQERVFSFTVANKNVGFHIVQKRKFSCAKFVCYFHLWSSGGPNWLREFHLWQKECDQEWTLVSPSKARAQMGLEALSKPRPKSAVKHTVTGKRLNFAEEIAYTAHKGYAPKVAATVPTSVMWTKSLPSISFKSVKPMADSPSKDVNGSTLLLDPTNGCSDSEREENAFESTGLEKVVDDIAFRFWDCSRCLSMGHKISDCTRRIRCRKCFRSGHIEKSCFNRFSKSLQQWVPKKI